MNPRIRRLGIVLVMCYVALFVQVNRVQVLSQARYEARPDNKRPILRDFNNPRGRILAADGAVLAESVPTGQSKFQWQRRYPTGELFGQLTGYFSFAYGSSGVEKTANEQLSGRSFTVRLQNLGDLFAGEATTADVLLSVRPDLQTAARDALGDRKGSAVVLDPRSGAVLALWSRPAFDPNIVSDNDAAKAKAAKAALDASPDKPLLTRAYQEIFFPGSTFKVVTASAGLAAGAVTETTPDYQVVRSYTPPLTNRPISNFDGANCGGTLFRVLAKSCNSAFAQMAAEQVGAEGMIRQAQAFGFNEVPPIDLPGAAASAYPTDFGKVIDRPSGRAPVVENTPALAQTGIGQNDVRATPLQMALVAATAANGGRTMAPHVIASVKDSSGATVSTTEPSVWRTPITPEQAELLRRAMLGVVADGSASSLQMAGVEVGAKTGTAQLGTDPPRSHAWMIAFAGRPGQPAELAVAVMVEGVPGASEATGGSIAGPIARRLIQVGLGVGG